MSTPLSFITAVYRDIEVMQRASFSGVLYFFEDDLKTQPYPLAGSQFFWQVRNQAGEEILTLTTEAGEGLTIQNVNELHIDRTPTQMNIPKGVYKYDLNQVLDGIDEPIMYGDFAVVLKQTQLPVVP